MNDKFFDEDTSKEQQNENCEPEKNLQEGVGTPDLSEDTQGFIPLKSSDEAEAEEENPNFETKENISTAFELQDYPAVPSMPPVQEDLFSQSELFSQPDIPEQPDIPDFSGIKTESNSAQEETAVQPQVNQEAPVRTQTSQTYNPYAPKTEQRFSAQNNVTPGYTNVNGNQPVQPQYQYQQNQSYGQQNPDYGRYNPGQPTGKFPEEPHKDKGKLIGVIVLVVCLVIAVVGMVAGFLGSSDDNNDKASETAQQTTVQDQSAQSTTQSENIEVSTTQPITEISNSIYVADKVRPSVVGVMTYEDGMLSGEGSGVLMSEKDGWTYIVTCAHVISESGVTYGVLLLDGTSLEAELVAYDERTDIGVIKVNKTGLPLAEFGDSSSLKIGEPVYAIGNPGGSEFFGSITNGIVSSIDRSISSTYTMTCIQHNAAINPGNSGGALVNTAGQVIGINSSKIASTDYEGMGFAVPTSIATPIVDALIQYGYVPNRPKLGIQYAPVSAYQLYSLVVSIKGLPQGSLVIAGISEDSSFANTEVEVGDLIIAVNGKDMTDSSVLLDMVETGAVGDTLTLTLCRIENRTYQTSTFDVTISLVEDKGSTTEVTEATSNYQDGYYYGGSGSFEDFFSDYFGW